MSVDSSAANGLVLTDEEWHETFVEAEVGPERPRPKWVRVVAAAATIGMIAASLAVLISLVPRLTGLTTPAEILARAEAYVDESPHGWLVSEVVVVSIEAPSVGAFVTNAPPDGIIHVDLRVWQEGRLDELMAHEIGHLVDFSLYNRDSTSVLDAASQSVRGGVDREVWAECSAVIAGERSLDGGGAEQEYRCRPDELAIVEAEYASVQALCRGWGQPECRTIDGDVVTIPDS